jgi:hypothetical protein
MSETQMNISEAFSKAQGQFKQPDLNRTAEIKKEGKLLYKTQYADLNQCIESVRDALSKNGLSFTQTIELNDHGWILVLTMRHSSGESIRSFMPLNLNTLPQSIGAQLTYLKRYQMSAFFGLAADFDDDGNATEAHNLEHTKFENKAKKQSAPENKPDKKPDIVLDPKDFIMPIGKDTKGKKLSSLSLETLTDISKYVEAELKKENKTETLNQFLLIKANVLKVISTFQKKESELPKDPKPDAGDSIIDIDFDTVPTESFKGKTLKMIPEKTLLAMISEIDKKMQSVPPPANLTALFSINSNIKAFLKSCEV